MKKNLIQKFILQGFINFFFFFGNQANSNWKEHRVAIIQVLYKQQQSTPSKKMLNPLLLPTSFFPSF